LRTLTRGVVGGGDYDKKSIRKAAIKKELAREQKKNAAGVQLAGF